MRRVKVAAEATHTRQSIVSVDRTKSPASTVDARVKNKPRQQQPFRAARWGQLARTCRNQPALVVRCDVSSALPSSPADELDRYGHVPSATLAGQDDHEPSAAEEEQQPRVAALTAAQWRRPVVAVSVRTNCIARSTVQCRLQFRAPQWTSRTKTTSGKQEKEKKRKGQGLPTSFLEPARLLILRRASEK